MISAPSEMRWKSMPSSIMPTKVMASTSGTDIATMTPVRTPRLMNDTTSTMASASSSEEMNSSNDLSTTSGWLATRCTVMPTGRPASTSAIALLERLAQGLHVAARRHDDAQADHRLALEAHRDLLRVLVAALDLGHVATG